MVILVLLFGYVALSFTLNRTIVEVLNGRLLVRHRPMPWLGNRAILVVDIETVYYDQIESARRRHLYNVRVVTNKGKALTIVGSLDEEHIAQSITNQLNKWLRETEV
jgi:hypothetical protein